MRTQDEIDDQLQKTEQSIESGRSAWPGMTYEQGVESALRWATGDSDDAPMDGDD